MEPHLPELDERFGNVWKFARDLDKQTDDRLTALETWRATQEAVSAWRRWLLPIVLSCVSGATTVLNVFVLSRHR